MILSAWKSLSPRRRKLSLWVAGLVLAYAVIGFLILPMIIRRVAVQQLSQQLNRTVTIQQVRVNPFALSATVRGLLIQDRDGLAFVSWDEVYVNFQISTLWHRALTFSEISTTHPFVRVQMNSDGSFNFSDIVAKFATNAAPAAANQAPAKPLALRIGKLHIGGAVAAFADFTPREPFKRSLGPLDITLENFRTDPDNKNPHAFTGTTDAGERISWSGFFYLDPLRSQGELTLDNFTVNKYAPLYQDLVRFQIRSGGLGVHLKYRFELSATNRVAQISEAAFALRDFRIGTAEDTNDLAALAHFAVTDATVDLQARTASVADVSVFGGSLHLLRDASRQVNVVQAAQPAETATNAPGGILFLLHSVTNVVNLLLQSTNQWSGGIQSVNVADCSVHLEDRVNTRPARLDLTDIRLTAKNISNLGGTNLTADFSLRWNTNGSIKIAATAVAQPPTAEVQLDLSRVDLGSLDPYLEPKLNLYVLGSEVGLRGKVDLKMLPGQLPEVTFAGDAALENFRTVDGVQAEDLLKWDALRFNGIAANLNPQSVNIREIVVDRAYARLVIETNRTINLLNALRPAAPAVTNEVSATAAVESKSATTNSPLPLVSIGTVLLTNTALSFTDRSLEPNVQFTVQAVNGTLAGLSTDQLQHAVLALGASVDGVGPVAINGTLNPLAPTATNDLKISLQHMDLTPASAYAAKFAGYKIAQGKLNLALDYQLVGSQLQAKNVITLDRFTFGEAVPSPDATKLPVKLAIAILKDREGKIVLDVPIAGSLQDPELRLGKVITRAVLNILTKVATSPFALLGAAFGGGEEMGYQDFAPGSAELTVEGKKKLDSLAKALYERPALQLEIIGSVDRSADREGLQRATVDREIRRQLWQQLRQTQRASISAEQVVIPPEERADWVRRFYGQAVAAKKITPELIAANTNLAAVAAQVRPRSTAIQKGVSRLLEETSPTSKAAAAPAVYQSRLQPPPDAYEALLLATYPVSENDFTALAAARVKAVQDYLVTTGQVEAARLFALATLRSDGSRAYLQFQ